MKKKTRGISILLVCLMLLTLFPGAAFAGPGTSFEPPDLSDILTQTLGRPVGMAGFGDGWMTSPEDIVEIAVQFVTPSAVALRLAHEAETGEVGLFSRPHFAAQALAAHEAFAEQLLPLTRASALSAQGRGAGVEIYSEHHNLFNGVFMRVPAGLVPQIADLPEVFSVTPSERVYVIEPIATNEAELGPEDFMRESLELFQMDYIHDTLGFRGEGLRVAVLDTGVDYTHPVLEAFQNPATGRIRGVNFTTDDPTAIMDVDGHGTHVSGTVVALAPEAELWHFKVIDDFGGAELHWVVEGVEAAHAAGMDVMNLSLGWPTDFPFHPWTVATELAMLDGVVVVNAGGNEGSWGLFSLRSPGSASLPISVAAGTAGGRNDLGDQMAFFSSLGPVFGTFHLKPDIVAPGFDIVSATPGGGFMAGSGTSMSAPHVAGIAVLMIEAFPNAATYEIKARMMSSARPLAEVSEVGVFASGAGFIDPLLALQSESFATVQHDIPWQNGDTQAWKEATMASLSFGGIWGGTESDALTISIHNPGGTWTPTVEWDLDRTGASLYLVDSTTSGATHTYTYQMRFAAGASDGLYGGRVVFTRGQERITVPFAAWFERNAGYPLHTRALLGFEPMTDGDLIPFDAVFDLLSTSDTPTGPIHVALVGAHSAAFQFIDFILPAGAYDVTETSFSFPGIEPGFWERIHVFPHIFLPPGTYTAQIEISGDFETQVLTLELNVTPFPFVDVARSSWYFPAVSIARQLGLMQGVSPQRFAPQEPLSRAMMAVLLYRIVGEPPMPPDMEPIFDDVPPGRWYSDAVNFAGILGIFNGVGDGRFAPAEAMSREQLATVITRFAGMLGLNVTPSDETDLSHFPDYAEISDWALESMRWVYEMGLIVGASDGLLHPGAITSRAESATILVRLFGIQV